MTLYAVFTDNPISGYGPKWRGDIVETASHPGWWRSSPRRFLFASGRRRKFAVFTDNPISGYGPKWRGDIVEADSPLEASQHFESNSDCIASRVVEIIPEKILVRKWVEEEV